jgi:hypothetical protein
VKEKERDGEEERKYGYECKNADSIKTRKENDTSSTCT